METWSVFKFLPPNIHPIDGAEWGNRRARIPGGEWESDMILPKGQADKSRYPPCPPGADREYKAPKNVGDAFYVCLRKLGYQKNAEGNYAQA